MHFDSLELFSDKFTLIQNSVHLNGKMRAVRECRLIMFMIVGVLFVFGLLLFSYVDVETTGVADLLSDGMRHFSSSGQGHIKLIILSYMRAGSTFVASMFEHNQDVFYMFEPEWSFVLQTLQSYSKVQFLDGTEGGPYHGERAKEAFTDLIRNILSCNLARLNIDTLKQKFMGKSKNTVPYRRCRSSNTLLNSSLPLLPCVKELEKDCKNRSVRAVKTTHMRMDVVRELLLNDQNVKVIHLFRDPAGITHSRSKIKEYYAADPLWTYTSICGDMLFDIDVTKSLSPDIQRRVLRIRYEDIAHYPLSMTMKLYDFVDMPLPHYVYDFVRNTTSAEKDINSWLGTVRENAYQTAYSWRKWISWERYQELTEKCARLYDEMGYRRAKSESQLRRIDNFTLIQDLN